MAAVDARQLRVPEIDHAHYEVGYGIKVNLDHQVIRVGSEHFMEMSGIAIPTNIKEQHSSAQSHSVVMVAIDETFSGAIELQPTIRPEAKEIIRDLHQRGKTLAIISGDHEAPTRLLAEELGIDHYFANTLPENKANIVLELQQEGKTICFVGDGINDAIALKQADVSISLRGATTIATDTAMMILMDGNLTQLTKLFTLAQEFKSNMDNILTVTMLPQAVLLGGTLFLHWGLVTTIVTNQLCWIPQLAWLFRPLHKHKGENDTIDDQRQL